MYFYEKKSSTDHSKVKAKACYNFIKLYKFIKIGQMLCSKSFKYIRKKCAMSATF